MQVVQTFFFRILQSLSWRPPADQKPEDSGYEIVEEIENSNTMKEIQIFRQPFVIGSFRSMQTSWELSIAGGLFRLVDFDPHSADTKSGTLIQHKLAKGNLVQT